MNDLQIEMLIRDRRDQIDRELREIRLGQEAPKEAARGSGLPRQARNQFADWLVRIGLSLGRREAAAAIRHVAIGDLDCVCRPRISGGQA